MNKIIHIGKESNKLEETNVLGVGEDGYQHYGSIGDDGELREMIYEINPKVADKLEISRSERFRLKKMVRENLPLKISKTTRRKLRMLIRAHKIFTRLK